jgi:hypothetical protein
MEINRTLIESTLVPHTAFERAKTRVEQCLSYSRISSDPICLALVGESRTGKSRVLEETASMMPRTRNEEGAVVPILCVTTPGRPTVKGVAGAMLQSLGDPKWEAGSENNKTVRLKNFLARCQTRMIMLDEFHHFFDKGTHSIFFEASDWLKTIVDNTGVALVVSGLESCISVLRRNEQLAGRFCAPVFMRRFHWLVREDRDEFLAVLSAFHDAMSKYLSIPELHNEGMAFRIWCATGGLMGYLTKFLRQVVWNACDSRTPSISLNGFDAAFRDSICTLGDEHSLVSPFSRSFIAEPTQEAVSAALSVGVKDDEQLTSGRRSARAGSTTKPPLSQVLAASGG